MLQKCVRNASEMGLVLLGKEERRKCVRNPSKLRQKCVKNPRNTFSGKEKAHKHKQIFPVTARAGGRSTDRVGGGLPTGGQG